jgi:hypothetical protein
MVMLAGCAHGNLKVDEFLRVRAHLVVEAELVLARFLRGKDEIALPLLLAVQDVPPVRASHFIVDIERTTRLHLDGHSKHQNAPTDIVEIGSVVVSGAHTAK